MLESLRRRCMLDLARRPLLLAGSGRSGTTWLVEMLNWRGDHRVIWEPLNVEQVEATRAIGSRRYLPAEADAAAERAAFSRVLAGQVRGPWIDSFNKQWIYRRRLVKVIRGNLMLPWVRRQFPDVPVVFMLRHPGAVVDSWLRQPWKQRLSAQPLLAQPSLVEAHGLKKWVGKPLSDAEDAVLAWCIENIVPLREVAPGRMLVTFYEDLAADPNGQLQRILPWYGLTFDPEMLAHVNTPSAMVGENSPLQRGGDPVSDWTARLDSDTQHRIRNILAHFGFDRIYGDDGRPRIAADEMLAMFTQ